MPETYRVSRASSGDTTVIAVEETDVRPADPNPTDRNDDLPPTRLGRRDVVDATDASPTDLESTHSATLPLLYLVLHGLDATEPPASRGRLGTAHSATSNPCDSA